MLHRVRSLVSVLVLSLPVAAAAQPKAPAPPQTAPVKTPASPMGTYTYCDAKMMSVLWKTSLADSKATIRAKVAANEFSMLKAALPRARENAKKDATARCNYDEAGLAYSDVEKLATMWKVTASKAKAMIEDKIIAGGEQSLRDMLVKSATIKAEDPTSTFLKQEKYTYCDVKLLSEYWKSSAKDAKARIGLKLQTNEEVLKTELNASRRATKLKCTYTDGGFTFKDVQKLAKLWHLTVADSKATIESKLMSGNSIYLKEEIRAPEDTTTKAYEAFGAQTKYSFCDAKMIGSLWSKSVSDGKLAIGTKLSTKKTAALVKLVGEARKNAKKNAEARCSYDEAGFSYDDVVILAKLWKKTESEVKALVPEKIAMGQEATIIAQLKKAKPKVKPSPPSHGAPALPPAPNPPKKKPMTKQATKAE